MSNKTAVFEIKNESKKITFPVSAVFNTEDKVEQIIGKLLNYNIARNHISLIGKNFEYKTKIAGFFTRTDVILDGLKNGAIFGSLFGSFLSLLTGVGVLFIPFVGSVVAAGPLSAALLGATSGAVAGGAGAGLVSALVALGMPEDKATIYQTNLQAGSFLLMAEVPLEETSKIVKLFKTMGGEEIHVCSDMIIPRQPNGSLESPEDLSPEMRSHLSEADQKVLVNAYNQALESEDEVRDLMTTWNAVEQNFKKDDNGVWSV